jgi:hypothetical protein
VIFWPLPLAVQLMWKAGNRPLLLCKMIGAVIHQSLTNSTQIEARLKAKNSNGNGKGGQLSNLDIAVVQAELISQRRLVDDQLTQLVDAVGTSYPYYDGFYA